MQSFVTQAYLERLYNYGRHYSSLLIINTHSFFVYKSVAADIRMNFKFRFGINLYISISHYIAFQKLELTGIFQRAGFIYLVAIL
jgi:hypothetical protein